MATQLDVTTEPTFDNGAALHPHHVPVRDVPNQNGAERDLAARHDAADRPRNADDLMYIKDPFKLGYDWPVVAWIVVVHAGRPGRAVLLHLEGPGHLRVSGWLTGSIGVCMGYHRQLTHGSFCTYKPVRWLLALIGGLSGEGSALTWVANHRKHHLYSDKEGDPHSPRDGSWWSHMFWFMPDFGRKHHETHAGRGSLRIWPKTR